MSAETLGAIGAGIAAAPSVSAEVSSSVSSFSSGSSLESINSSPGLSSIGEISNSFQDGVSPSYGNPFAISAIEKPSGLDSSSENIQSAPQVLEEALSIVEEADFEVPLASYDVIFEADNVVEDALNSYKQEEEIFQISPEIFTESPVISDETVEEITQSFTQEEQISVEQVVSDILATSEPEVIESETLVRFVERNEAAFGLENSEAQDALIAINEAENVADVQQAVRVMDLVRELELGEDFAQEILSPVLEQKGISFEDVQAQAISGAETEIGIDAEVETISETQTETRRDIGNEADVEKEARKRTSEEPSDMKMAQEYRLDSKAFAKRTEIGFEAVREVFKGKGEKDKTTGEEIVNNMPKPDKGLMSEINPQDPTFEEYVLPDIARFGEIESAEMAKEAIETVNKRHVPVAWGAGKAVTSDEIEKVRRGRKGNLTKSLSTAS